MVLCILFLSKFFLSQQPRRKNRGLFFYLIQPKYVVQQNHTRYRALSIEARLNRPYFISLFQLDKRLYL